jgi:hypothetical protein
MDATTTLLRTVTLIPTPKGLQPFIAALWRLTRTGINTQSSYPVIRAAPSWCNLALDFSVKAPIHREALRGVLLGPWKLLHGVKELALIGDIGDSMRLRLQNSMLERPLPAEVFFTLTEYHIMALREIAHKDFTAAQWWWSLHEDCSRYHTHLSLDPLMEHRFKDADNELWAQMWN